MQKTTWLLIDDDEDDRELFKLALEEIESPPQCHTYASCTEALENIEQINPDFIFMDLNMPLISGRQCMVALKTNPQTSHIPIIIFSTSSDPRDIEETLKMGAVDFITKPNKTSELTNILNNLLVKKLT